MSLSQQSSHCTGDVSVNESTIRRSTSRSPSLRGSKYPEQAGAECHLVISRELSACDFTPVYLCWPLSLKIKPSQTPDIPELRQQPK